MTHDGAEQSRTEQREPERLQHQNNDEQSQWFMSDAECVVAAAAEVFQN